jgi:hypothetical protein
MEDHGSSGAPLTIITIRNNSGFRYKFHATAAKSRTAECGFRDEAALYENTFQQYGQIFVMNADGSEKRALTDSRWEDSMPLLIPAKLL